MSWKLLLSGLLKGAVNGASVGLNNNVGLKNTGILSGAGALQGLLELLSSHPVVVQNTPISVTPVVS